MVIPAPLCIGLNDVIKELPISQLIIHDYRYCANALILPNSKNRAVNSFFLNSASESFVGFFSLSEVLDINCSSPYGH